jgi:hypothetical protein
MDLSHLVAILVAVVGATWALRTKLSDIEVALNGHVKKDEAAHDELDKRVIKLEARRVRK